MNRISHDSGARSWAGKAAYQYGQRDEISAMRRGAPALRTREVRTRRTGEVRWMMRPVVSWMAKATQREGKTRRAVPRAGICWTSWKLRALLAGGCTGYS